MLMPTVSLLQLAPGSQQFGLLRQSSGRLVFRYGHEHRSAVDLHRIDLIAVRRDELPRHTCQLVGFEIEGFADRFQKAAGDLFPAIHVDPLRSLNAASPKRGGFERNRDVSPTGCTETCTFDNGSR